jgi:hypothetical protein
MKTRLVIAAIAASCGVLPAAALAQVPGYVATPIQPGQEPPIFQGGNSQMDWNTVDNSGGIVLGSGNVTLEGTVGQADAGPMVGAQNTAMMGGFWAAFRANSICYANCDGSTSPPILNILDFNCFLNKFASGDPYANCDGSTTPPVLNILDFNCFLNKFAAGCPGQ